MFSTPYNREIIANEVLGIDAKYAGRQHDIADGAAYTTAADSRTGELSRKADNRTGELRGD